MLLWALQSVRHPPSLDPVREEKRPKNPLNRKEKKKRKNSQEEPQRCDPSPET